MDNLKKFLLRDLSSKIKENQKISKQIYVLGQSILNNTFLELKKFIKTNK